MTNNLLSQARRKNYLYVEGSDDANVFLHLLNYHQITDPNQRGHFKDRDEQFEIKNCDGFHNILKTLALVLKGDTENQIYGIVIDADTDLAAHWAKTRNILEKNGYTNLPSTPNDDGIIVKQDGLPVIGIWLMPNNKLPGAIEHFVSFLGPQDDPLWSIAQDALQQAISTKCNFKPSYKMKAHLHTWLSWQKEPGTPMGQAITKKYVNAEASHAVQLVTWFRKVFELEQ